MAKTVGTPDKFNIILFLALLGALVCVVTKAGGSQAYGAWATQKIRSKRSAELATSFLGVLIFIDDYFNCLTVGTVMKPVTDKYHISRAKLAYIIDTTAAPVCIIAPVSSWAAAVGSTLFETGSFTNELSAFFATIPFNMYAILSILMVLTLSFTDLEFGPMADAEWKAETQGDLGAIDQKVSPTDKGNLPKGTVWDLIIPIGGLIIFTILAMIFEKQIGIKFYLSGCIGAVVLVACGAISEKAAYRSIDMQTIFVYGGTLALAKALQKTGAGKMIADTVISALGPSASPFALLVVVFLLATLMTNFMSNFATTALLVPISLNISAGMGADPKAVVVATVIGASLAFATPIGMPANMMVFAPGGYTFNDYVKAGLPMIVVSAIISLILLPLIFPFYP